MRLQREQNALAAIHHQSHCNKTKEMLDREGLSLILYMLPRGYGGERRREYVSVCLSVCWGGLWKNKGFSRRTRDLLSLVSLSSFFLSLFLMLLKPRTRGLAVKWWGELTVTPFFLFFSFLFFSFLVVFFGKSFYPPFCCPWWSFSYLLVKPKLSQHLNSNFQIS